LNGSKLRKMAFKAETSEKNTKGGLVRGTWDIKTTKVKNSRPRGAEWGKKGLGQKKGNKPQRNNQLGKRMKVSFIQAQWRGVVVTGGVRTQ